MIPNGADHDVDNRATLDDLFRRAGVRHPDALALADPLNRESFTGGAPRWLTYATADRAISALAARLRGLGLQTDTVVALQLPNTVDGIVALLGVLRAGMIAAPLPLLWRKQEIVAALSRVGARAIVTAARIGACAHAELAAQAAAELFPVRFICGFGPDLPDGVAPLDGVYDANCHDFLPPPARPGNVAAHVAAITFDVSTDGLGAVPRSHGELIAGGRAAFLAGGDAEDATILSTIPPGSFAGIALTVVPWLIGGGALALHQGFDPLAFAEQCRALGPRSVVVPGPALTPLSDAGLLGAPIRTILALWRAAEQLAAAAPWHGDTALVDVAGIGESGLLSARRGTGGLPALPQPGPIAPPAGMTAIGFYRFRQHEVDAEVAHADPTATIVAFPDAGLGQRFTGKANDPAAIAETLQARGVNSLIAGAFRPRSRKNAA